LPEFSLSLGTGYHLIQVLPSGQWPMQISQYSD